MNITARIRLNPEEVTWLESDINYTKVFLIDGSHLIVAYTLKKIEDKVKDYPDFIRINKSYIINCKHINSVRTEAHETFVLLQNKQELPVSRRKRSLLKEFTSKKIEIL